MKIFSIVAVLGVFLIFSGYNIAENEGVTDLGRVSTMTEEEIKVSEFGEGLESFDRKSVDYKDNSAINFMEARPGVPFKSENGVGVVVRGIYDEVGYEYMGDLDAVNTVDNSADVSVSEVVETDSDDIFLKGEVADSINKQVALNELNSNQIVKVAERGLNGKIDSLGNRTDIIYEGEEYPNVMYIRGVEDFKLNVLASKEPVIVFIQASWCSVCKRMNRETLSELDSIKGVRMVRLELDKNEGLRLLVGDIIGFPTTKVYHQGKMINKLQKVGYVSIFDVEELGQDINNMMKRLTSKLSI